MVFLEKGVRVEHIVLEGLYVATIESDEAVSPHDVHTRSHDTILVCYVRTMTTEIGWCLL